MKKYLLFALCSLLFVPQAQAAIPYRAEQVSPPPPSDEGEAKNDPEALARLRRYYVGGMYNMSFWQDGSDGKMSVAGKNDSSFEAMVGVRVYDTFRLEANYYRTSAQWDAFSLSGNTVFLNALFDARIDSLYRLFRRQRLVPYVGFGAGASWNSVSGATIDHTLSPSVAALAGLGIELGDRCAIDFGYRYFYMFSPKFDVISNFAPVSHQLRAGVRFSF